MNAEMTQSASGKAGESGAQKAMFKKEPSRKYTAAAACVLALILLLSGILSACTLFPGSHGITSAEGIPPYNGEAYTVLNGNKPTFTKRELSGKPFEIYSELDSLGRCGPAFANICPELLPEETRGTIGSVKPTGWHTVRYDDIVEGKYLYNRCHLIGYQLSGENANPLNLITGTRYLNISGMLPFENRVETYVRSSGNHVLYRSTPVFEGNDLLASGIQLEAMSVEDRGKGICFNVFLYNVQPGIVIDYATGESFPEAAEIEKVLSDPENRGRSADGLKITADSEAASAESIASPFPDTQPEPTYILNTSSMKIHNPSCKSTSQMSEKNKLAFFGTRQEAIDAGYSPCGICKP